MKSMILRSTSSHLEFDQIALYLFQMFLVVLELFLESVARFRNGQERSLKRFVRADGARQRRRREHGSDQVDGAHPVVQLVRVGRLKEVLGPVGRLEPKDELLLLVVDSNTGVGVVYAYGVGDVVVGSAVALEALVVLVQVEDHVAQRGVEHLPAALEERRLLAVRVDAAFAQQPAELVLLGRLRIGNLAKESESDSKQLLAFFFLLLSLKKRLT